MTTYLHCKKCGGGVAMSTIEYMAIGAECPHCGAKDERRLKYLADKNIKDREENK
jgi:Zn finger protein HypA/HybF involved in hydrogenase expression